MRCHVSAVLKITKQVKRGQKMDFPSDSAELPLRSLQFLVREPVDVSLVLQDLQSILRLVQMPTAKRLPSSSHNDLRIRANLKAASGVEGESKFRRKRSCYPLPCAVWDIRRVSRTLSSQSFGWLKRASLRRQAQSDAGKFTDVSNL